MSEHITNERGEVLERIVRCKDCANSHIWNYRIKKLECWANGEPFDVEPDGFCAWARLPGEPTEI